ncbi:DUF5926 family protein [Allostreptomyces psammosilenae]|uniref:DUF5926 domain-containing protein n=1 Tax=Allostreptomyces psammosilenae TaxID=1892865 RepID=A0A852ZW75_9ACTN|nr:DUF5926 family protein [Allostreptomyces psammosilenae]NYI05500.1 hypothetical protein [Allostreptomyces psammosilenae]
MAKKAAKKAPRTSRPATPADGAVPVVGAREPCPCGSGRRYKACHGKEAAHAVQRLVRRPFEGMAGECDWVAMRELVPAATAPLTLRPEVAAEYGAEDTPITLATVLPLAWPGMKRADGKVLIGLQTQGSSGDVARDLGHALARALRNEPGEPVPQSVPAPDGPRLPDLLDTSVPLDVTVHEGFEFWLEGMENPQGEVAASLERANAAAVPTVRLTGVEAAYWCRAGDRNHLRWVMPHEEEALLEALARLHAAGASGLGEGTRFVGSFRAHGLLVPVWDLPVPMGAEDVEKPAAEFAGRLAEALAETGPLSPAERRARDGLLNRQLTIS